MRFLVVGGLSIATDAGALFVLHGVAEIWLPLATALAFAVSFVVNFGLNRMWAFGASGAIGTQLGRYLALVAANLMATVALVPTLTWAGLPYLVAKLITAAGLALANYLVFHKWIFTSVEAVEVPR